MFELSSRVSRKPRGEKGTCDASIAGKGRA